MITQYRGLQYDVNTKLFQTTLKKDLEKQSQMLRELIDEVGPILLPTAQPDAKVICEELVKLQEQYDRVIMLLIMGESID